MPSTKAPRYPLLRFDEFKQSWRPTKLSEITNLITSGSRDWAQYYSSNGDKFIRMTNLPKDGITLLLDDLKYVKLPLNNSEGKRTSLKPGDILISITAELGKIGLVPSDLGKSYINQHTALVRLKSEFVPSFIAQLLASSSLRKSIYRLNDSGAKAGLNLGTIQGLKFYLPEFNEQQKIADFLSAVDEKIRLLKEKHALLQQYKKGVMQKLFSQEIRFKDDNVQAFPDWVDTPVGEFMAESKVLGSKGDQAKKLTVKLWGKGVFAKDESQQGSENTQYYVRSAGQFIYSKLDFLNCAFGIVPDELDGYESTIDLPCFDIATSINKYFILEYIKQKQFYKKFGEMADGSRKAKRIHAKDFLSFTVRLPSEREQQKIADFLQALDKKLDAVQQQIDLTQTFKKGLLQQMFV